MAHIFVSYSHKDQIYARAFANDLRKHGFDVWIDDRIDYGDRWFEEIEQAIVECAAFTILMSPDSRQSEWVQKEILIAKREKKPIFPLLLSGQEFGLLIDMQFADVTSGTLPNAEFYRDLGSVLKPAAQPGEVVTVHPRSANRFNFKQWWTYYSLTTRAFIILWIVIMVIGMGLALNAISSG